MPLTPSKSVINSNPAPSIIAANANIVKVNSTVVSNPFTFNPLINGIGPDGEIFVNGTAVANNRPCMAEYPQSIPASARAVGTVYQNNNPYPILVVAEIQINTGAVVLTAFSDSSAVPTTQVWINTLSNVGAPTATPVFFVLPGQFYKITTSSGTATISSWREFVCQRGAITDSGDIHASKALSTIYQNNTAKTLFVAVQITGTTTGTLVQALSDPTVAPASVVDAWWQTSGGSGSITTFFVVPPYHYYEVTAASGSLSLWHEYSWAIPCQRSLDLAATTFAAGALRQETGFQRAFNISNALSTATNFGPNFINNDIGRVRWVQIINSSASASASLQLWSGDSFPAITPLNGIQQFTANALKTVKGPIMPLTCYSQSENVGSGTLSNLHWWEYSLG